MTVVVGPSSPSRTVHTYCVLCGATFSNRPVGCCDCGGMLETGYAQASEPDGLSGFYLQYWGYLPLVEDGLPVLELRSRTIGAPFLDSRQQKVFLKLEADLPTGSTKDRAAAVAIPYLRQVGIREIVLSSTGNTSTAYAYMARYYPEMLFHIFVGKDFAHRLSFVGSPNVIVHVINGNFIQAGEEGKRYARARGLFWEGGFFNPGRRDGLKTSFIEAVADVGSLPSVYAQAVSSGMGVVGSQKAVAELSNLDSETSECRPIAVQQETCAPMVTAWAAGRDAITDSDKLASPSGIAKAILRGDPSDNYPALRKVVADADGLMLSVADDEIRAAQRLLWENLHLAVCEASAAALAGYLKARVDNDGIAATGWALVNLTGSDRNEVSH